MISNRKVDALILTGEFLIDLYSGFTALMKYDHDISLVESGFKAKDLGYNNDANQNVTIISPDGRLINFSDFAKGLKEIPQNSIAKVSISGVMQMASGMSSSGIVSLSNLIQDLDANPRIAGFLFDVNSGGGEATAGVHLYNTIKDLKKPSVAQVHTMASAAYMAMLPVKEMVALSPMSRIGSIGAMISLDKNFIQWYKSNIQDIYSTLSPDKNEELNALLNGDNTPLVKSLDKLVTEFHSMVNKHRSLNPQMSDQTLKGGTFPAKEAKYRGLIDSIGTEAYATKRLNFYIKNQ